MHDQDDHDRIAVRAYAIWLERCAAAAETIHGTDVEDWLQAENELALEGD